MIELPEVVTIARQIRNEFVGKRIEAVSIAEDRPKFMFLNEDLGTYDARLVGRKIGAVTGNGKWIFSTLDSGDTLLLGEMFGRILYVPPSGTLPKKVHGTVVFEDGGRLIVTIQAWGGFQVLTPEELAAHPYAGNLGISPIGDEFTPGRLDAVLDNSGDWSRKPIKAFLVHEGNVCGVGNGYLQDVLFRAKLSPKRKVPDLSPDERKRLHRAIVATLSEAIEKGGRDTEVDLYGQPGRYVPILDRRVKDTPCPDCGTPIEKISYLGGSCYVCPSCQPPP
jgi:formamidopyrimidine-DNA glycosylase